jgi:hypothetical protein
MLVYLERVERWENALAWSRRFNYRTCGHAIRVYAPESGATRLVTAPRFREALRGHEAARKTPSTPSGGLTPGWRTTQAICRKLDTPSVMRSRGVGGAYFLCPHSGLPYWRS